MKDLNLKIVFVLKSQWWAKMRKKQVCSLFSAGLLEEPDIFGKSIRKSKV
jgi:hypothetical protein